MATVHPFVGDTIEWWCPGCRKYHAPPHHYVHNWPGLTARPQPKVGRNVHSVLREPAYREPTADEIRLVDRLVLTT